MKVLKPILVVIFAGIALLFIVAAFLPAKYHVQREVWIGASPELIYKQIVDLNNYRSWNAWADETPQSRHIVSDTPGGVGAFWQWDGTSIGKGSLTILKAIEFTDIHTKVEFADPWQESGFGFWSISQENDSTRVEWKMEGQLSFPLDRYSGLFINKKLGRSFEKGLANLKIRCENN